MSKIQELNTTLSKMQRFIDFDITLNQQAIKVESKKLPNPQVFVHKKELEITNKNAKTLPVF
jgi:hypothetical protein